MTATLIEYPIACLRSYGPEAIKNCWNYWQQFTKRDNCVGVGMSQKFYRLASGMSKVASRMPHINSQIEGR